MEVVIDVLHIWDLIKNGGCHHTSYSLSKKNKKLPLYLYVTDTFSPLSPHFLSFQETFWHEIRFGPPVCTDIQKYAAKYG